MAEPPSFRLSEVALDERTLVCLTKEIEREREAVLDDLLKTNSFRPLGSPGGPYKLVLSIAENRLVFDIRLAGGEAHGKVMLSLTPFNRIIKDYFLLCDSYFKAISDQTAAQIETIDMGRRGLHDEGAKLLLERLRGKIEMDLDTARRLFTLICVLHRKGLIGGVIT